MFLVADGVGTETFDDTPLRRLKGDLRTALLQAGPWRSVYRNIVP